jgi:tRNA G18 (ribose-2'-O)-methylase SpoU
MSAASFQIRVCQNPDCGLRYPLQQGQSFGERCPACLGQTVIALEQPLEREWTGAQDSPPSEIKLSVVLDNVRSASNVGSILRSADAFEFVHAYLCGITPTPESPEVRKTALGAERFVAWSAHKNAVQLIEGLKERGTSILALERERESIPIHSETLPGRSDTVLVVGNEVTGIDPGVLEIADRIVHLPMRGHKRSFNVAVAFAIAAQSLRLRT